MSPLALLSEGGDLFGTYLLMAPPGPWLCCVGPHLSRPKEKLRRESDERFDPLSLLLPSIRTGLASPWLFLPKVVTAGELGRGADFPLTYILPLKIQGI